MSSLYLLKSTCGGKHELEKKTGNQTIDKFMTKITSWKSKTLSFGCRLTLITSVLDDLPTYYLSLFPVPNRVLEQLEKSGELFFGVGQMAHQKTVGYLGIKLH